MSALCDKIPFIGPILGKNINTIGGAATNVAKMLSETGPVYLLAGLVRGLTCLVQFILAKGGSLGAIRDGIMSNELNNATIAFVWNRWAEIAVFLVDLVECAKCYALATSLDGKAAGEHANAHGKANELDFEDPMCRHSVVCQFQRLAKSLIYILRNSTQRKTLDEINMTRETQLDTDNAGDVHEGVVLEVRPSGRQRVIHPRVERDFGGAEPGMVTDEKWFFVNGIATELYWLHLACKKLAKHYNREVTGIFNRSEGFLWDLIECLGQRTINGKGTASSQKSMVQQTKSSDKARLLLKDQLRTALERARDGDAYKHIVVVAHSQGCLVLRLVLEDLVSESDLQKVIRERLCVFTFGNPSVVWNFEPHAALRTEHFANEKDFVARLGVLDESGESGRHSGYDKKRVFVNSDRGWVGHLFGTQYSLDSENYEPAEPSTEPSAGHSWLLACQPGTYITGEEAVGLPNGHANGAVAVPNGGAH